MATAFDSRPVRSRNQKRKLCEFGKRRFKNCGEQLSQSVWILDQRSLLPYFQQTTLGKINEMLEERLAIVLSIQFPQHVPLQVTQGG